MLNQRDISVNPDFEDLKTADNFSTCMQQSVIVEFMDYNF